jgi:hypothetical protein
VREKFIFILFFESKKEEKDEKNPHLLFLSTWNSFSTKESLSSRQKERESE